MGYVVTLAQVKAHLRITDSSEDTAIQMYLAGATTYIRNRLNSRIPGEDLNTPNIPDDIKSAALMLIAEMYEHRSIIIESRSTVSPMVDNLLSPYRKKLGI